MAKYCVVPDPSGGPDSEFIMGTYPGAEAECEKNGGHVETRGDGCGSSTSASAGPGASTSQPLAAAVVGPIRTLRSQLPESDVMRDLEFINYSPELLRMLEEDEAVQIRIRDAVGMVSQFAFLTLVDPQAETLHRSHYTEDLHRWLAEAAEMVRERTDDQEFHGAVERLVRSFEQRIGQSIGEIAAEMRGDNVSSSS